MGTGSTKAKPTSGSAGGAPALAASTPPAESPLGPVESSAGAGETAVVDVAPALAASTPSPESPVESSAGAGETAAVDGMRVVVYLGASAPVHATHTKLIETLVEGFDKVFIFILAWSPDRAGVTASAGAAQLNKWLLGFPTEGKINRNLCHARTHCVQQQAAAAVAVAVAVL